MNIRDEVVLRELNLYPLWVASAARTVGVTITVSTPKCRSSQKKQRPVTVDAGDQRCCTNPKLPVDFRHLDWTELKQKVHDCTACKLRAGCTQTVFGVGDESAEWLFVGEGPGADEDAQGEPFVGQAGKLLDNMLAAIKLKRGSNVYIANIVKCRPPNNRTPEADEIATCMPYLQQQIALIKPKLIVALGKTAATSLLGREATLGSLRGTVHDYQGIPLIVTYHPAYLLRSPAEKAKAWQDLCFAVQRIST